MAFIKSIFSPTQYIWKKDNPLLAILTQTTGTPLKPLSQKHAQNHKEADQKLKAYLESLPQAFDTSTSQKEKAYLAKTLSLFNTTSKTISIPLSTKAPNTPPIPATSTPVKIKSTISSLTPPTPITSSIPPPPKAEPPVPKEPPTTLHPSEKRLAELEQKLKELLSEKEKLVANVLKKEEVKTPSSPPPQITIPKDEPKTNLPTAVSARITKDFAGMPSIPSVGNIIMGVIRDNIKRLLPGIIVTVKDPTGMPVRALKTNKLGQFAAATPLENGRYFMEIEDPLNRFRFDTIEIDLVGKIFTPIEIIAKGQREILRDKLSQELFGSQTL